MREISVVDDGSVLRVRHHLLSRIVLGTIALGFLIGGITAPLGLLADPPDPGMMFFTPVGLAAAWYFARYVVDAVIVDRTTVTLRRVGLGRPRWRTIDLRDVESAESGYDGLTLFLADADSDDWPASIVTSSVLQSWNLRRWLGRPGRSDRICAIIEHRSALARGEDPGPIVLHRPHSVGEWTAAAWTALVHLRM